MSSSITLPIGKSAALSIVYLDQKGRPMTVQPVPDSAPAWSNSSPATATLVPSGVTATETALAEGSDTVSLTVVVGGVSFSDTLPVTVPAAPQVLTSVQISAVVGA